MTQQIPPFPQQPASVRGPFVQRPARVAWVAQAGDTVAVDLPCGRDLTHIEAAMLYVYTSQTLGGMPTVVPCSISNAAAGVVSVEYNTGNTSPGTYRWTLFLIAPAQPVPVYTGTLAIQGQD